MELREIKNELLDSSYFEITHDTGLKIFVYPKTGYSSTYAIFGTDYGSIDADGIPNGTAHFLEHKLFESDEVDAFQLFAQTGANANAYTTFDRTCYLFSCGDNFKENLKILLDFVTHPYFTEETVRKEQGIIGQEIRMYQDEPSWQVLFNLLRAAYQKHPVRIDIAGTVESIADITADMLYSCIDKFYSLGNMALACVGNTSVEEVLAVVDEVLGTDKASGARVTRHFDEPYEVGQAYIEEHMAVAMPQFALGFKEPTYDERPSLREKLLSTLILDCVFGETTEFYNKLLDDGYISPSFGGEYFTGPGFRLTMFTGDSREPQYVAEEIKLRIKDVIANGINEDDFERVRRSHYGRAIMDYNDIDGLANELVLSSFEGFKLFDEIDVYKSITLEEANERLKEQFDVNNCTLSVILPKE